MAFETIRITDNISFSLFIFQCIYQLRKEKKRETDKLTNGELDYQIKPSI